VVVEKMVPLEKRLNNQKKVPGKNKREKGATVHQKKKDTRKADRWHSGVTKSKQPRPSGPCLGGMAGRTKQWGVVGDRGKTIKAGIKHNPMVDTTAGFWFGKGRTP